MEKKIQSGVCEATWMLAQTSIALNLPCKSDVSSWISCKILSKIPLAERSPLGRSRSIFKAVISAFIFDDWAAEQHSEYHTRHFFFFFAKSFLLIFFKWVTCSDSIWRSIGRSLPRTNSWNDLDRGANSWYSILPDLDTSHLVTFTYLINLRAFPSILTSRKFYSDIQVVAISQARRVKSCCWPIQRPASGRPGPESIWMLRGCSQFECCVEQTGRHSCAATATVSTQWCQAPQADTLSLSRREAESWKRVGESWSCNGSHGWTLPQSQCSGLCGKQPGQACIGAACLAPHAETHSLSRRENCLSGTVGRLVAPLRAGTAS